MTPEDRLVLTCWWSGLAVLVSVLYIEGGLGKAVLIALFVAVSSLLGFGRRWLLRGAFALSVLAIAVALGFPAPARWPSLVKQAPGAISAARAAFFDHATNSERN